MTMNHSASKDIVRYQVLYINYVVCLMCSNIAIAACQTLMPLNFDQMVWGIISQSKFQQATWHSNSDMKKMKWKPTIMLLPWNFGNDEIKLEENREFCVFKIWKIDVCSSPVCVEACWTSRCFPIILMFFLIILHCNCYSGWNSDRYMYILSLFFQQCLLLVLAFM